MDAGERGPDSSRPQKQRRQVPADTEEEDAPNEGEETADAAAAVARNKGKKKAHV